eukprot:Skav230627  [mRNA]  locus=scaffold1673:157040:165222:+ [translate_table: standard]
MWTTCGWKMSEAETVETASGKELQGVRQSVSGRRERSFSDSFVGSKVVLSEDGAVSFDFVESEASKRSLQILQSVVSQEDPELLQRYLQRSPFSLEALLVMAEHHRRQAGYDQARELIRRAVYTLECAFAPDFSPFETLQVGSQSSRPRVRLQMPSREALEWPGWSWLRALWMQMHCLAGQGMHRSSMEVCKLLLAACLPQDPLRALLWLDHLCLRSRSYKTVPDLSVTLGPTCGCAESGAEHLNSLEAAFPNWAYSVALAGILQQKPDMSQLNHLTLEQILHGDPELEGDLLTCARLMRALLYYPGAVRPLLEEAPGLRKLPFSLQTFVHACAVRWVKLHESPIFQKDIADAREAWAHGSFAFSETLRDYEDVLPDDGMANPPVPLFLEHALSARLHPKREEDMGEFGMFRRAQEGQVPNMSIYSPPLILFFQSLMPWSVLDQTGVTATPLLWKDIGRGLAMALKDTVLFIVEATSQLLSSAVSLLQDVRHRATD